MTISNLISINQLSAAKLRSLHVINSLPLDPYASRILFWLYLQSIELGYCESSVETISKGCQISIKRSREALVLLEKSNLINREDRIGKTSIWTVTIPQF